MFSLYKKSYQMAKKAKKSGVNDWWYYTSNNIFNIEGLVAESWRNNHAKILLNEPVDRTKPLYFILHKTVGFIEDDEYNKDDNQCIECTEDGEYKYIKNNDG